MVPETYRELFGATASTAGALTGLLFVALSVAPRREPEPGPQVIQQVRAASALLAFTNALAVALFSLVPGTNTGYPAVVVGIIGLFFTAAAVRSIVTGQASRQQKLRQVGLISLLLLIFGTELICGIVALSRPHSTSAVQIIGYALVTSLIAGVARAWELVGTRGTGILTSIAVLTSRAAHPGRAPEPGPEPPPAPEADT